MTNRPVFQVSPYKHPFSQELLLGFTELQGSYITQIISALSGSSCPRGYVDELFKLIVKIGKSNRLTEYPVQEQFDDLIAVYTNIKTNLVATCTLSEIQRGELLIELLIGFCTATLLNIKANCK